MLNLQTLQKNTVYGALSGRGFYNLRWLACICLLATLLLGACTKRTELNISDQNLIFKTLKGNEIALNKSTGPVLVSFWSTSCTLCLHEMPGMAKLYNDYAAKGFELIAVAMPYDAPNEVLELATERKLPFPVALDVHGEATKAFGSIKGTPTSFLLNSKGKLVKRYVGAVKIDKIRIELDKLLALG